MQLQMHSHSSHAHSDAELVGHAPRDEEKLLLNLLLSSEVESAGQLDLQLVLIGAARE